MLFTRKKIEILKEKNMLECHQLKEKHFGLLKVEKSFEQKMMMNFTSILV